MAVKNIIAMGVGFSPGDTHYIPTAGFDTSSAPPTGGDTSIAAFPHVVGTHILVLSTVIWRFTCPHLQ